MTHDAARLTPDTPNIRTVKALYAALPARDLAAAGGVLVADPVWDIAPGAPDGGTYRGMAVAEVFGGFYPKLAARFRTFEVLADAFADNGTAVHVCGRYRIVEREGDPAKLVRFAHVFGLAEDGRVSGVWQVADTALLAPAG